MIQDRMDAKADCAVEELRMQITKALPVKLALPPRASASDRAEVEALIDTSAATEEAAEEGEDISLDEVLDDRGDDEEDVEKLVAGTIGADEELSVAASASSVARAVDSGAADDLYLGQVIFHRHKLVESDCPNHNRKTL